MPPGYYWPAGFTADADTTWGTYYYSSTASDTTWDGRGTGDLIESIRYTMPTYRYTVPTQTPQQIRAEQERCERERQQREAERLRREKEEKEAEAVAEGLLRTHLGKERFGQLVSQGHVEVDSARHYPGCFYRIKRKPGMGGLIDVVERATGSIKDRLCIHIAASQQCPLDDEILAKVVLAEADEAQLVRVANHHPVG